MEWLVGQPRPVFYTIENICEMLGWTETAYYRHVREGRFPRPRRMGTEWRYLKEDIDAYLTLAGRWYPGPFDEEKKTKKGEDKAEAEES